jgi:hypothetical protein
VPRRVESHFDLELRAAVMHDILDMMPEERVGVWLSSRAARRRRRGASGPGVVEFSILGRIGPPAASTASSRGRAAATPSTRLLASDRADAAAARRAWKPINHGPSSST